MSNPTGTTIPRVPGLAALHRAIRLASGLPMTVVRALAGNPLRADGVDIDLHTQLLATMQRRFRVPPLWRLPPALARAAADPLAVVLGPKPEPMDRVDALALPLAGRTLPARLYRPAGPGGSRPLLVYLHGGGFVIGGLDSHDGVCRRLAREVGCDVAAVGYRLAPESPFPAAVHDSLDAYRWLIDNAGALDLHPTTVAVGGDSAGGTLSAVLCQQLLDGSGRLPDVQLLIYPATDLSRSCPSHALFARGPILDSAVIGFFLGSYLPRGQDPRAPEASPLFGERLTGLPPALLVTAGFDPLRDEGRLYAEALKRADVSVNHLHFDRLAHGFINVAGFSPAASDALDALAHALRGALAG